MKLFWNLFILKVISFEWERYFKTRVQKNSLIQATILDFNFRQCKQWHKNMSLFLLKPLDRKFFGINSFSFCIERILFELFSVVVVICSNLKSDHFDFYWWRSDGMILSINTLCCRQNVSHVSYYFDGNVKGTMRIANQGQILLFWNLSMMRSHELILEIK